VSSDEFDKVIFRFKTEDASTQDLPFLVHSMKGEEALGSLFVYRVKLIIPTDAHAGSELYSRTDVALTSFLNKEVSLCVPLGWEDRMREFNGLATDIRLVDNFAPSEGAKWFYYEVAVRPKLWLLSLSSHCRVFSRMTVLQIVDSLLKAAVIDYEIRCHGQYPLLEICAQYNETDFEFLSRLLLREGIYYYFVHSHGKHVMIVTDSINESALSTPNPYESVPTIPYQYAIDESEHPGIYQWHYEESLCTENVSLTSYDFKSPKANQADGLRAAACADVAVTDSSAQFYVPSYKSKDDGERLAQAYLASCRSRGVRAEAEGNMRSLSTGGLFTLQGTVRKDQHVKYLVTRASYIVNAWRNEREREERLREEKRVFHDSQSEDFSAVTAFRRKHQGFTCSFEAIPYERDFHPSMLYVDASERRSNSGYVRHPLFQTAIVVGVEDRQVDADAYTRIKVRFHWENEDAENDAATRPGLRLSKLWAGSRFGVHVVPRIGQEVIVAFTDVDEPVIVGCVDNEANRPPWDPSRFPGISTIRTQSIKNEDECSEIRFNDDAMQLLLYTTGQYDNRVEKDKRIWVGQNEHHIVKGAQRLQVDEQDLIVDNDQKMKVGGKLSLAVAGPLACGVKGEYAVEGKTLYLHGNSDVVIRSNSAVTLQAGSSAIKIDSAGVHIHGAVINLNTEGAAASSPGECMPDLPEAPDEADSGALDA
jgi:type VI secretion system secreted protein VgrG